MHLESRKVCQTNTVRSTYFILLNFIIASDIPSWGFYQCKIFVMQKRVVKIIIGIPITHVVNETNFLIIKILPFPYIFARFVNKNVYLFQINKFIIYNTRTSDNMHLTK